MGGMSADDAKRANYARPNTLKWAYVNDAAPVGEEQPKIKDNPPANEDNFLSKEGQKAQYYLKYRQFEKEVGSQKEGETTTQFLDRRMEEFNKMQSQGEALRTRRMENRGRRVI